MPEIIPLTAKNLEENCYVFKHSTRCSFSGSVAEEVRAATFPLPLYWVNVIEQRPLSDWIEEHYGVRHESPQLILIRGGKAAQSWSHAAVTRAVRNGKLG